MLAAGAAGAQVPGENEETRLPYEQLPRHQNEMQLGLSHVRRDRSAERDVRTETAFASIALSRGMSERLELGLHLPYVLYSEQTAVNGAGTTVREEHRYGLGDPTFRARYGLRREDGGVAVTVGLLATPDWGGRAESFNAQVDILEPFIVLGKSVGTGKAYLRYGYLRRSGDSPDAHHFTLGGRHPVGQGFGVIGHVSYVRSLGSAAAGPHGAVAAALGGYADLGKGMQFLAWVGASASGDSNAAAGRDDEARNRQIAFSFITRF
jgi:hypothetical protein